MVSRAVKVPAPVYSSRSSEGDDTVSLGMSLFQLMPRVVRTVRTPLLSSTIKYWWRFPWTSRVTVSEGAV
jgi:hypothetical protein